MACLQHVSSNGQRNVLSWGPRRTAPLSGGGPMSSTQCNVETGVRRVARGTKSTNTNKNTLT